MRGSPSLVGRGIANPMFARTRGFKSPSPRHQKLNLIGRFGKFCLMGRRKTQKIIRTGPKNATTGMCPVCKTIGKVFLLGPPGQERGKCEKCRQEFEL